MLRLTMQCLENLSISCTDTRITGLVATVSQQSYKMYLSYCNTITLLALLSAAQPIFGLPCRSTFLSSVYQCPLPSTPTFIGPPNWTHQATAMVSVPGIKLAPPLLRISHQAIRLLSMKVTRMTYKMAPWMQTQASCPREVSQTLRKYRTFQLVKK